jgi:hypothetical protein
MSFLDELLKMPVRYSHMRDFIGKDEGLKMLREYNTGRLWIESTTGEIIPSWREVVTPQEKQLSSK